MLSVLVCLAACSETPQEPQQEEPEEEETAQPPDPPAWIAANATGYGVEVKWPAPSVSTFFNLYWSTSPGVTKDGAERFDRVPSGFNHKDVTPGIWYYYRVVAVHQGIESELSPEARALVSPSVAVWIDLPQGGNGVASSTEVVATVQSDLEIAAVTASMFGAAGELTFSERECPGRILNVCWRGTVPLGEVEYRTIAPLAVTVIDVQGDSAGASVTVIKDERPVLTVLAPVNYEVARPEIRLLASCTDDGPECAIRVFAGPDQIASATNDLDVTVPLAFPAGWGHLRFEAVDAGDPTTEQIVGPVFVEGSTELVALDSAPGGIMDVDETRILYFAVTEDSTVSVIVRDRASAVDHVVIEDIGPVERGRSEPYELEARGRLTPVGAVFHVRLDRYFHRTSPLYEWRDGTVSQLAAEYLPEWAAAGDFVAYDEGEYNVDPSFRWEGELKRRNVVTGETSVVVAGLADFRTFPYDSHFDLASNGDVVYNTVDQSGPPGLNIFRFNDLGTEQLTFDSPSDVWNAGAKTDGASVVFTRQERSSSQLVAIQLVAITPGGQIALTPRLPVEHGPDAEPVRVDYALANGWIAYSYGHPAHLWLRSPAGVSERLTLSTDLDHIEAVGPEGGVFFNHAGPAVWRRYFVPPGEGAREIGTTHGRLLWLGSKPLVLIGRMAFEVR